MADRSAAEALSAEELARYRRIAAAALNTWVGRNWPSMEAMRRDGMGHGLVERSGKPDRAIRRFIDTFQPDLVLDLLDRFTLDRERAAAPDEAVILALTELRREVEGLRDDDRAATGEPDDGHWRYVQWLRESAVLALIDKAVPR